MTKRYQCKACGGDCVLEVDDRADKPYTCPYGTSYYTAWHLLDEEVV